MKRESRMLAFGSAIVLVAVLCGGACETRTVVDTDERSPRPVKAIRHVWTGPPPADLDDTWAISLDGERLAFRDEQSHLAVYEFKTAQKRPLTDDFPIYQDRTRIIWSPDGTRLAYNRNKSADQFELRIARIDKSPSRIVAERRSYIAPLAWSPTGDRLLVLVEQGTIDEIAWLSLADGHTQPVKRLEGAHRNEWHPRAILSADGQQIAFSKVTGDGRNRDVFMARADGTHETSVVEHPSDDYPIAWTVDGRLLFASDRTGQTDLWAVPTAGRIASGIAKRVHRDLGLVRPLGVTRGGALYYVVNLSMTDVFTAALDPLSVRVAGTPAPVARRFSGNNSAPDFSPDDDEIVYQVGLPGTGIDLVFQSRQGVGERVIHPKLQFFSRPRFDPLGAAVAVHGTSADGIQGIFRVDKETGEVVVLASNPSVELTNPAWTRDGRKLFFERDDRAVWMLDRQTKQTSEVYALSERADNFTSAPSSDGSKVAIVHGASLSVVDVASKTAREIVRVKAPERFHDFPGSLAWMPNGRHIIFGKTVGDQRALWRISVEGAELEPVGVEARKQNIYFLRVSQDGRRMAFVMGDYDVRPLEVWVMENFLQ